MCISPWVARQFCVRYAGHARRLKVSRDAMRRAAAPPPQSLANSERLLLVAYLSMPLPKGALSCCARLSSWVLVHITHTPKQKQMSMSRADIRARGQTRHPAHTKIPEWLMHAARSPVVVCMIRIACSDGGRRMSPLGGSIRLHVRLGSSHQAASIERDSWAEQRAHFEAGGENGATDAAWGSVARLQQASRC